MPATSKSTIRAPKRGKPASKPAASKDHPAVRILLDKFRQDYRAWLVVARAIQKVKETEAVFTAAITDSLTAAGYKWDRPPAHGSTIDGLHCALQNEFTFVSRELADAVRRQNTTCEILCERSIDEIAEAVNVPAAIAKAWLVEIRSQVRGE